MKNTLCSLFLIPVVYLAGCSTNAVNETAASEVVASKVVASKAKDSERTKYTYANGDTKYNYLCEKKASTAQTEAHAKAAHEYFTKQSGGISEETVIGAMADARLGNSLLATAFNAAMSMQGNSRATIKEVEAKFQCTVSQAS